MLGWAKVVLRIKWFALALDNIVLSDQGALSITLIETHIVCCVATFRCELAT
jgi:hypothetical protein